jgi:hypothetical protein
VAGALALTTPTPGSVAPGADAATQPPQRTEPRARVEQPGRLQSAPRSRRKRPRS